jgi:hypothetical protein
MATTRTEYAVRYTEQADSPPTIDAAFPDATDRGRADKTLVLAKIWQAKHGLPVDAEIVTRTITTTDWAVA